MIGRMVIVNVKWGCAERSAFGRRAGRRGAPTGERGAAKWRGRGLGQRNIKN